ncbi:hypothetical protein [Nonomuraea antimicrobica]|uniref:hypothetical protein n=1 Tax=Nonomuraea antimicrobica TaxID=561173 RepID=UPI0031E6E681
MSDEFRFDYSALSGGGRDLTDSVAAFRRRTDTLLATVHGTGGTAFGGTATGAEMDSLTDLLSQACEHLCGNMNGFGEAMQRMAEDIRLAELTIAEEVASTGDADRRP